MPATNSRRKPQQQAVFSRWAAEETAYIRELVEKHTDRGVEELAQTFLKRFETRTSDAVKQRIFKLRRTQKVVPKYSQVVPAAELGGPLEKAVRQTLNEGAGWLVRSPEGIVLGAPSKDQLMAALSRL